MQTISFSRGRWAPNTQAVYKSSWANWEKFAGVDNLLPAPPALLADFLSHRAAARSMSDVSVHLAAIRAVHKYTKGKLPKDDPTRELYALDDPVIADRWAELRRQYGTAKTPKRAIAIDDIQKIIRGVPLDRVQDRAIMLVGFKSAMRRSELVALNVDDLVFTPKHLSITIRRSKTDKDGKGEVVAILRGGEFCAVNALERWLAIGQIAAGAVFRIGDHRMPPRAVATITKRWAKNAGYNPREIAAHSLRRGCITTMHRAGVDPKSGMALSRHKTISIYLGYVADHAAAENPAIKALSI